MTFLSVNLNKIALVRNTRTNGIPSVTKAARIALGAGAHGITVHPRPDGRHVRPDDVAELAALVREWPNAEFNIEGNPFHGLLQFVRQVRPHQCTLVPDESGAFTSDSGWDLRVDSDRLRPIIAEVKMLGTRVSLFMDPIPESMQTAKNIGADRIELYTEPYALAFGGEHISEELRKYQAAADAASKVGLGINAGHDLNLENLGFFLRSVPGIMEVSIGHALISDALEFGLAKAVQKYLDAITLPDGGRI